MSCYRQVSHFFISSGSNFPYYHYIQSGLGSVVGIANGYGLGAPEIESRWG